MAKALIFDFDGVIVLSEQARFTALQNITKRYGVEMPDALFQNIIGRTTGDFFKLFMPQIGVETLQPILDDFQREYKDRIVDFVTPISATTEFIETYTGDKVLAVASGSGHPVLEMVLKHIGIYEKFSTVVGKEDVTEHKPNPAVYFLTAKQIGIDAADCVVIEDTVVGAQAALNAGMSVYVFLNGINNRSDFAETNITGFIEDIEQLKAL